MSAEDMTDWFKITAYFAGECTVEQREALEHWLSAVPERRQLVLQLRAIWEARRHQPGRDYGREDAIAQVMARIRMMGTVPDAEATIGKRYPADNAGMPRISIAGPGGQKWRIVARRSLRQMLWSPAMALAFAIVVAVIGWSAGAHHLARRAELSMLTYTTGNGQRANITLPDGNTVALDVASRLEVPADYMTGDHVVRLDGQGLFTITHRDGSPFTVLTGSLATRVLGTSFMARHYATDTTTVVAVRDGKVSVRSLVLTGGRQVEFDRIGTARVRAADPAQFGFVTGVLTINGALLRDAVPELNRWYDADIRLGDSMVATRRITGGFTAGSLADLTELLKLTFNIHVVRDGRIITLYQR